MTTDLTEKPEKTTTPVAAAPAFESIRDVFLKNSDQLKMALPKFITPERMIRVALTEIRNNPRLLECSPASLFSCLLQCSQLGLEPGPLGHIYLVPFRDRKSGRVNVQLICGYKGMVQLARRSGQVATIHAHAVRAMDEFSFAYGLDPLLIHKPARVKDRGEREWFYCAVKLKDGESQFEVMSKDEIDEHRDRYSKAAKEGPWVSNYEEMALKTVVRRIFKWIPSSAEMQLAVAIDEQAEAQLSPALALGVDLAPIDETPADTEKQAQLADVQKQLAAQREAEAQPVANAAGDPPVDGARHPVSASAPPREVTTPADEALAEYTVLLGGLAVEDVDRAKAEINRAGEDLRWDGPSWKTFEAFFLERWPVFRRANG